MIPSRQPSRHHGERGTRKCDGPEFAADADPEMPGQRVDDAGDGPGQEDPRNTRQDMRRGHPNKGSAVEGCREHSLIKQAYSSAEPCEPAHHGRPLDSRHPAASDGKLDRQGSQHHVDNIVQEERNGGRNGGGMVQSCENTQAHKDESGGLPRVVLGKEGGEVEEPNQQAASGGEKGFACTRQPTTDRGRVGLLREIYSLLRHTGWTFLSGSLETVHSRSPACALSALRYEMGSLAGGRRSCAFYQEGSIHHHQQLYDCVGESSPWLLSSRPRSMST